MLRKLYPWLYTRRSVGLALAASGVVDVLAGVTDVLYKPVTLVLTGLTVAVAGGLLAFDPELE